MGRMILCRAGKASVPYYVHDLGLHLYTAEELCYYIYNNLFLLNEDFLGEPLFRFIGEELKLKRLEEKVRALAKGGEFTAALLEILKDICYYNEQELEEFKKRCEKLKRSKPYEVLKNRGDYMAGQKKYKKALWYYDRILNSRNQKEIPASYLGKVWYNKGACYAGIFSPQEAASCFIKAYGLLKDDSILKELYLLSRMWPEAGEIKLLEAVPSKQQYDWTEEFDSLKARSLSQGKPLEAQIACQKDRMRRKAAVEEVLSRWKKEYRDME